MMDGNVLSNRWLAGSRILQGIPKDGRNLKTIDFRAVNVIDFIF